MKKVINVGIGGRSFSIEDDAYERLNQYLKNFQDVLARTGEAADDAQSKEVMSEIEGRIAELLNERITSPTMAVSLQTINEITHHLGMPDGSPEPFRTSQSTSTGGSNYDSDTYRPSIQDCPPRKLFRDPDHRVFGGICSGLSYYFDSDITPVRLLMLLAVMILGGGLILYLIMWIIVPKAKTPAEKCIMRGIPASAENMRKFY